MIPATFDAVVAGAGIAGIATTRFLVRRGMKRILLVDPRPAMQYTSAVSTECFRDAWPLPESRHFMSRSIDLLDELASESGDFKMHRPGYLFVTRNSPGNGEKLSRSNAFIREMCAAFEETSNDRSDDAVPAGFPMVREHRGSFQDASRGSHAGGSHGAPLPCHPPPGVDVLADKAAVRDAFPYLDDGIVGAAWARRCGWLPAHTAGMVALEAARQEASAAGGEVRLVRGAVDAVHLQGGTGGDAEPRVVGAGVSIHESNGKGKGKGKGKGGMRQDVSCGTFVNCTGPAALETHRLLGAGPSGANFGSGSSDPWSEEATAAGAVGVPWWAVRGGDLPLYSELHAKVLLRDTLGVVPRDAPMVVLADGAQLDYDSESLEAVTEWFGPARAEALARAAQVPGAHLRPYGGPDSDAVLMLWEGWHAPLEVPSPAAGCPTHAGLLDSELYPELCLRALSRVIPDLMAYAGDAEALGRAQRAWVQRRGVTSDAAPTAGRVPGVDGGYYTRTAENLPLVGASPAVELLGEGEGEGESNSGRAGEGSSGSLDRFLGRGGRSWRDVCREVEPGALDTRFTRSTCSVGGAFTVAGLSGYGIMASMAAGEMVAAQACGEIASFESEDATGWRGACAKLFDPARYQDPDYVAGRRQQALRAGGGQL